MSLTQDSVSGVVGLTDITPGLRPGSQQTNHVSLLCTFDLPLRALEACGLAQERYA